MIVVSWRLSFPIHEPLDKGHVVAPVVIVSNLLSLDWKVFLCVYSFHEPPDQGRVVAPVQTGDHLVFLGLLRT